MTPEFEWDARKAAENLKNHGVDFDEAVTVFADPLAKIFDDSDHSHDERREIIIRHFTWQRMLVVSFSQRGGRTSNLRARERNPRGGQNYEKGSFKKMI